MLAVPIGVANAAQTLPTTSIPLTRWQHTAFSGERGPPSPLTEGLELTPDGYLWAGSAAGLLRFDGVRFTLVDSTIAPELARVSGELMPLEVDASGRLWLLDNEQNVVSYFNGHFQVEDSLHGIGMFGVDRSGRVWATSDSLLLRRNGRFEPVHLNPMPQSTITGLEGDLAGGVWIGTAAEGIWHLAGDSMTRIGGGRMRVLLHASDGAVWTQGDESPYPGVWRLHHGVWTSIRSPDGGLLPVRMLVEGPDGSVWIPSRTSGLLRWRQGQIEQYSHREGLLGSATFYAAVTPDGTVYVSTDAGLERLRIAAFVTLGERDGLPAEFPPAFTIDHDGQLWSARIDGTVFRFRGGALTQSVQPMTSTVYHVPESSWPLTPSRGGGIWLGPANGGLLRLTPDGKVESFGRAHGLPPVRIIHALEGPDGALWIRQFAHDFGRLRDGQYREVALPERTSVSTAIVDGRGRILTPGLEGDKLFMIAHDSLAAVIRLPGPRQVIWTLAGAGDDTVWAIGRRSLIRVTGGQALEVMVPSLSSTLQLVKSSAVSRGFLWLAGLSGIARVATADLDAIAVGRTVQPRVEIFDELDGVPVPRSTGNGGPVLAVAPDGRVWLSTPAGLAVSSEAEVAPDSSAPMLHIEEVEVGARRVRLTESGWLPPNPERVAIHFSATGSGLAERMRIEYRLVGSDRTWIASRSPRVATYERLRPGHYRFEVRAWNEWDVPAAATATLSFRVRPAWYQATWFLALCLLSVAAAGGAIAHVINGGRHRRRAAAVKARFEAVLAERTRLARELHDTLLQGFTGLTLQIDGVRAALEEKNTEQSAVLSAILERADRTLRDAREMVWDMRHTHDGADLAEALRTEGDSLANPHGVTLEYVVTGAPRILAPTVVVTLLRIAREATANALNHARATKIIVTLAYTAQSVELEVRDDGCGADPRAVETASARGHWGVAGMRERARSVGAALSLSTAPGKGTRVGVQVMALPDQRREQTS
jgi:signal transduction histidine kinase